MPAIIANSVLSVRLFCRLHGQVTINNWLYRNLQDIPDTSTTDPLFFNTWQSQIWQGYLQPALSNELNSATLHLQWIHPTRYIDFAATLSPATGGFIQTSMPSGVSMVVRRYSILAGRKNRGRIYLPGLYNSGENDSQIASAYYTANADNFAKAVYEQISFLDGATVYTFQPILWNKATPAIKVDITNGYLDPIIRYQRRREIGVGV